MNNKQVFKSQNGLVWHYSGLNFADSGVSMKCYIWNGCILLEKQQGQFLFKRVYYAPDGKQFFTEEKLMKYLNLPIEETA